MDLRVSSGSIDFDRWLDGGYEKDVITMIAGPPGTGKTNLALMFLCKTAIDKKVAFIDTEGGFSIERIKQISEDSSKVLKNTLLFKPTNFYEMKDCFDKLLRNIKNDIVGAIILDGIAMLYRLEMGEANHSKDLDKVRKINLEVSWQLRTLTEIARKKEIPVLITNQVYAAFSNREEGEKEYFTVGGDLFRYWSKCIIELSNKNNKRRAFLSKHRSMPQKDFIFEIKDRGLFKKGWL